ncbi:hypothetical protein WICPIJ_007856 [Wickerhamomyces pijperi]|uniref:Transcription regulator LGE1 helical region domain-containing protein n=1 Tax=Wickerhamomyces pijperi TaxID=599730 RepID=A0A9P8PZF1_WICPI|nr:hypothetical protein WICPIJ_007856 [Wickerhamomyces pijperi]
MSGHYPGGYNSYGYSYREHERSSYPSRGGSSVRGRRGGYGSSYSKGSSYTPGQLPRSSSSVYRPGQSEASTYIPSNQQKKPTSSESESVSGSDVKDQAGAETQQTNLESSSSNGVDKIDGADKHLANSASPSAEKTGEKIETDPKQFNTNRNYQSYQTYQSNRPHTYRGGYRNVNSSYHPYNSGYKSHYNKFNGSQDSYGNSSYRNSYDQNYADGAHWRTQNGEANNKNDGSSQKSTLDNNRTTEANKSRNSEDHDLDRKPDHISNISSSSIEGSSVISAGDRPLNSRVHTPEFTPSSAGGNSRFASTVKSVTPSPLVDILSLNSFRHVKEITASGSTTAAELSKLKESLNEYHDKSTNFQKFKLEWEKDHILSDFHIERLKAQVRRDEINVKCTEEKLDSITLI